MVVWRSLLRVGLIKADNLAGCKPATCDYSSTLAFNYKRPTMRKKTAINLLKTQKKIFELESYDNRDVWFQKTASLIELVLGRESNEYHSFSHFEFGILTTNPENVDFNAVYKQKRKIMIGLLNNCIDKLNITGIYKPPKDNLLSTYNNWQILSIIVIVFIAGLSAGIWLSETKSFSFISSIEKNIDNHTQSETSIEQTKD